MTLEYIFARPKYVEGVGNIYPVQLKDWDEFQEVANVLLYSKKHFVIEKECSLLELIIYGLKDVTIIDGLERLFRLSLRNSNIQLMLDEVSGVFWFQIADGLNINIHNYDTVREIIMKQNLIHEPKVYKDPRMQEWANKVLQARSKSAIDMSLEDQISTVSAMTGKHYWELENYTMYQLSVEFNRICKLKEFDVQASAYSNPNIDTSKTKLSHFAEKVDVFKSPYDDLFKSKDKLNNINKAIQG